MWAEATTLTEDLLWALRCCGDDGLRVGVEVALRAAERAQSYDNAEYANFAACEADDAASPLHHNRHIAILEAANFAAGAADNYEAERALQRADLLELLDAHARA